jgi:hypothetical protein
MSLHLIVAAISGLHFPSHCCGGSEDTLLGKTLPSPGLLELLSYFLENSTIIYMPLEYH